MNTLTLPRHRRLFSTVLPVLACIVLRSRAWRHIQAVLKSYAFPKRRSTKMALLIGIQYDPRYHESKTFDALPNVHEHTRGLQKVLEERQFDVTVMLDDPTVPNTLIPTRANIFQQMDNLTRGMRPDDQVVFVYSGHGHNQICRIPGQEADDKDECIIPVDWKSADDDIRDDELNRLLVGRLRLGTRLFALFDACHSGTALDLKHSWYFHKAPRDTTSEGLGGRDSFPARSLFARTCDVLGFSSLFTPKTKVICFSAAVDSGRSWGTKRHSFLNFFTDLLRPNCEPQCIPISVGMAFTKISEHQTYMLDLYNKRPEQEKTESGPKRQMSQLPQLSSNDPNFKFDTWLEQFF